MTGIVGGVIGVGEVEGGVTVVAFVTTGWGVVDSVCGWVIGDVVGASIKICYFG